MSKFPDLLIPFLILANVVIIPLLVLFFPLRSETTDEIPVSTQEPESVAFGLPENQMPINWSQLLVNPRAQTQRPRIPVNVAEPVIETPIVTRPHSLNNNIRLIGSLTNTENQRILLLIDNRYNQPFRAYPTRSNENWFYFQEDGKIYLEKENELYFIEE